MEIEKKIVDNRAYLEMLKPAVERLNGRKAEDIAAKTQIKFDEETSEFCFTSMGQDIRIHFPQYTVTPDIDWWNHLVILHYMDMADGMGLSTELISFGELKDGLIRGGGFDRQCENEISQFLGNQPEERVREVCEVLGVEIVSSNADLCAVFSFLPLYPITLKIWFADDEIAGSGKMLLNGNADHFLTVEDAVTAGSLILEKIVKCYEEMF